MSPWPEPARPADRVKLHFSDIDETALDNLSAATRVGDTLFVAADEHASIESLVRSRSEWGRHQRFAVDKLLPVSFPNEEADFEGLAAEDGWLWVVGSHARTRPKPEKAPDATIDLQSLARLNNTAARAFLGRIPLVEQKGRWTPVEADGDRRAGILRQKKGGNALTKALKADQLLRPFTRIPAKEGGIDIEGIAVCDGRVALGMRGPVIGTHAVLLEITVRAKPSGRLKLACPPVQRLLALEGLGIRDLKRCDGDLLILAGPTSGLDGPCALYRWPGWADDPPRDASCVRLHRPERILELPFGRGEDHPEGLAFWNEAPGKKRGIMVIYDTPAAARIDRAKGRLVADVFALPD